MARNTPALVTVCAREGVRVPREGAPRQHIAQTPVQIHLTPYYQRQLADGDLVLITLESHE